MIAAQCAAALAAWHGRARNFWCVRIGRTAARFGFVFEAQRRPALFDLRCHREQLTTVLNAPARTYNWTAVLQRVLRLRIDSALLLPHGRSCHCRCAWASSPRQLQAALVVGISRGAVLWRGAGDDAARRRRRALRRRGNSGGRPR